jgi:outer membrane protein TolC
MSNFLLRAVALTLAVLPTLTVAAPLTLTQALDQAVQRSEATRAALAGVTSASEAAHSAGQLPDPTLRVGVDNLPVTGGDRISTTRDSMTMKRIGIAQEWVSAEKRAARQAAADAMVSRETVTVQATAADARLQTALAFIEAYFAGEMLKLTTLSEHHVHEELEAAKARLSSSAGSSQEVLAGTSSRGISEDESGEVRQLQSAARVVLERWVGFKVDELTKPVELARPDERTYIGNHPMVLAAKRDFDLARQEAAVAASNRKPNWSWEVSYGQRTGYSDMVSLGVSIPLPVSPAERQDRETTSKLALIGKAEGSQDEATRAAQAEYRGLTSDEERLTDRIQRYQSSVVVPTQQRTAAALAGYRSNQVPLTTLFEARHMEVEAQRKVLALQRELAKAQAQLAFKPVVTGGSQ